MMINESPESAFTILTRLFSGARISQAINVAVKLGIPDLLKDGAENIDELAKASDSHAPSLDRLLRALASVGIFTEIAPQRFALTPIGKYLQKDHPESLHYLAIMNSEEWVWGSIGEMYRSVKEGKPAISDRYSANSYWEYLTKHPEAKAIADNAMVNLTKSLFISLMKFYDFSNFSKVVDVGGGKGLLISLILKNNPHLQGILFDLPETFTKGTKVLDIEEVAHQCEVVGGDMFKSVPTGGDLYILSLVLADWDSNNCSKILQNVRQAIPQTGKLLVIDLLITPGDQFHQAKWIDIFELCLGSGKISTEIEYREIFEKSGFKWVRNFWLENFAILIELVPI